MKRQNLKNLEVKMRMASLPGINVELSDDVKADIAFQRQRDALIALLKNFKNGRCWSCNAKRANFITDDNDLSTLRKRCLKCLRKERAQMAAQREARQRRQDETQSMLADLQTIVAMPRWDRDILLEPLRLARVRGSFPIAEGSPLWNQIAVTLLRKRATPSEEPTEPAFNPFAMR